jgi:hypothetical protein
MNAPQLNHHLFWDTDASLIDWQTNANAVIIRVLERGDLEDFREIRRYYGNERIKKAATKARCVYKNAVHFVSLYYNIPLKSFRCYKNDAVPIFPLVYSCKP